MARKKIELPSTIKKESYKEADILDLIRDGIGKLGLIADALSDIEDRITSIDNTLTTIRDDNSEAVFRQQLRTG